MDASKETLSKSSLKNSRLKSFRSSSLISDRFISEYEDMIDKVEGNKSACAMKKIYSINRIGSSAKTEAQKRSNEKMKVCKLFRASSTSLERNYGQNESNISEISSGARPKNSRSGNDLFLLDILHMKKYALSNYIQENPKAADIKWSLFCAACHSYRYDSVLRPFPPMFLDGDTKNIDRLRRVTESCPGFHVLYEQLQERNSNIVSPNLVNLLYWVLIHTREPHLKFIPEEMHKAVLSEVTSAPVSATPNYIFQVTYNKQANVENFNNLVKKYRIIHAYHGSRLDNFYSILNFGLRTSFNKSSIYGPGIYLSSEMNVSLPYSKIGFTWGGSYFGSQISVVALCEMLDHPGVKFLDSSYRGVSNRIPEVMSMPDKYFLVQNSDLIRVKYLLIYRESLPQINTSQLSTFITWFQRNKILAVMISYVIILLAVSTCNNETVLKYYNRILRKLGLKTNIHF